MIFIGVNPWKFQSIYDGQGFIKQCLVEILLFQTPAENVVNVKTIKL